MIFKKYSINNLFKLILIFGIIFSATNSAWAVDDASSTLEESSTENQELPNNGQDSASDEGNVQEETTDTQTDSNNEDVKASEVEEQSERNNTKDLASPEFLTLKNILLLFAIVDLPTLALLLTLWFLDRKEQKQKLDYLINGQNKIDRKLKQLDKITLKLEESDKLQNKIAKDIEQNKQEIINSRIELLSAFEKKQSERSVNSNGNASSGSNNYYNSSISATERTEDRLEQHKYSPIAIAEKIPQFVDKYNSDKKSLSYEAIATVSATETSLNERRLGKSDILTLESTSQKKYWIVQEGDHYLVPHAKIKIDEYNKTTLESLFECINFSSDYTDFYLIQPAKVSQLDSELWQLEKKGKLEFS